jgi:branched-chain amino acid aminotransferase
MAPNTYPAAAKLGGQYVNSQFIAMEAAALGYTRAIALSVSGYSVRGQRQNIFLVQDGCLFTPPLGARSSTASPARVW